MKITIKNYKSCRGNEGDAFSCTMYLDGKRAALVTYDGWGGEYFFDFTVSDGKLWGGPTCMKFEEYVKSLPPVECSWVDEETGKPEMMDPSRDMVLEEIIEEMLVEKQIKRWCKNSLVYRVKGQKKGEWFQANHPAVARYAEVPQYRELLRKMLEELVAKKGEELEEIANDRFIKAPRKTRKSA